MPKRKKNVHEKVPLPVREHIFDGIRVSIYKVKDFEEQEFINKQLLSILKKARRSYIRYGDVPSIDSFDTKASIYLAKTQYTSDIQNQSVIVEEWSSVRFIPASGEPFSTEDLEACLYQGQTLSTKIPEILFQNHPQALDRVVTVSRICRIKPKFFLKKKESISQLKIYKKNLYTGLSLFLMTKIFLEESEIKKKQYNLLTALSTPELFDKALHFMWNKKEIRFPFAPAYKVLQLPLDQKIDINRPFLSYKYPAYFLHKDSLFSFFSNMVFSGKIKEKTLKKIFELPWLSLHHLQNHKLLSKKQQLLIIKGFSKIFLSQGWIEEGRIHSDEIRNLSQKKLKDTVQLYLSPIDSWKKHFYEIETILF